MAEKMTVFYAGLLYGQYPVNGFTSHTELPDGCYVFLATGQWYHKNDGMSVVIEIDEVPKPVRLMALLLQ